MNTLISLSRNNFVEKDSSPVTTEKTKTHLTTEDMTTTNHGATSQPTPEEMTTTDHDITSQPQPVLIEPSNVKSILWTRPTVLLDEITTPTQIESVVSTCYARRVDWLPGSEYSQHEYNAKR